MTSKSTRSSGCKGLTTCPPSKLAENCKTIMTIREFQCAPTLPRQKLSKYKTSCTTSTTSTPKFSRANSSHRCRDFPNRKLPTLVKPYPKWARCSVIQTRLPRSISSMVGGNRAKEWRRSPFQSRSSITWARISSNFGATSPQTNLSTICISRKPTIGRHIRSKTVSCQISALQRPRQMTTLFRHLKASCSICCRRTMEVTMANPRKGSRTCSCQTSPKSTK